MVWDDVDPTSLNITLVEAYEVTKPNMLSSTSIFDVPLIQIIDVELDKVPENVNDVDKTLTKCTLLPPEVTINEYVAGVLN
jgi:hypothetical protein